MEFARSARRKSSSTRSSSSCCTAFMAAIAAPSFCTSRGPRNFITSAASSSPSASIRIAPFCDACRHSFPSTQFLTTLATMRGSCLGQLLRRFQVFLVAALLGRLQLAAAQLHYRAVLVGLVAQRRRIAAGAFQRGDRRRAAAAQPASAAAAARRRRGTAAPPPAAGNLPTSLASAMYVGILPHRRLDVRRLVAPSNGLLITLSVSPRSLLKPIASLTRSVIWRLLGVGQRARLGDLAVLARRSVR